jgi:hypothetical protein
MNKYQMTESEKELFLSGDEGRGRIRQEAALSNRDAESVQIVDSVGDLFDVVVGSNYDSDDTNPGMAIVLTDEQLRERRLSRATELPGEELDLERTDSGALKALEEAYLAHLQRSVSPQFVSRLEDEINTKLREEYAETISNLRAENAELTTQIGELTGEIGTLKNELATLKEESKS